MKKTGNSFLLLIVCILIFGGMSVTAEASKEESPSVNEQVIVEVIKSREKFGLLSEKETVKEIIHNGINEFGTYVTKEEHAEIENRIEVQENQLPRVREYMIQNDNGSDFAGIYIDQKNGGIINVGFTKDIDDMEHHIEKINGILHTYKKINFFNAKYSENDLNNVHEEIFNFSKEFNTDELKITSIKTVFRDQLIEVGIIPYNKDTIGKVSENLKKYNDIIKIIEGEDVIDDARDSYTRPLEGGLKISNGSSWCTGAFSGYNANGYYYVTAGHCGANGSTWSQGGTTIGSISDRIYGAYADAAAISINPSNASWYLYVTSSQERHFDAVEGWNEDNEGDFVCKSGATTGYSCGTIDSTNYSGFWGVTYFTNLRTADYGSQGGDSGAPVFTSTKLKGVNKGSLNDGTAVYSHIQWVMSGLGLNVLH